MGKQGGQGKGKPKLKDKDFGKALMKRQAQGAHGSTGLKTKKTTDMKSILDNSALEDFINTVEMDENDFEVLRVNKNDAVLVDSSSSRVQQQMSLDDFHFHHLVIPRKPHWDRNMTAEEVDMNEKKAFLQWRRNIASMESGTDSQKVTPFEKNLDVWRQLWRVTERCDILVQIVDARNPLLYYTSDLMKYVRELNPPKHMILLVNKADFLTEYQRLCWARYFDENNIKFIFYSAKLEQIKLDESITSDESNSIDKDEIILLAKELVEQWGLNPEDITLLNTNLSKKGPAINSHNNNNKDSTQSNNNVKNAYRNNNEVLIKDNNKNSKSNNANNKSSDAIVAEDEKEEEDDNSNDDEVVWGQDVNDDNDGNDDDDDDDNNSEEDEEDENELDGLEEVTDDDDEEPVSSSDDEEYDEEEDDEEDDEKQTNNNRQAPKQPVSSSNAVNNSNTSNNNSNHTTTKPPPPVASTSASISTSNNDNQYKHSVNSNSNESQYDRERRRTRVLTRNELHFFLDLLPQHLHLQPQSKHNNRICVGMVGYPNVGKSSVINTLLGVSKSTHGVARVAVSSTPGKTKHFQTLILSDSLMICDCPGLVFPSFMNSTGEMLCAGILPINQMRDYIEPATVMALRVPRHLLDAAYGMKIVRILDAMDDPERPPTPHEMLCAYCAVKGYITNGTGRWDEFRACKELLRDFADGRILYVARPSNNIDNTRWLQETEKIMLRQEKIAERIAMYRLREIEQMMKQAEITADNDNDDNNDMVFGDFNTKKGSTNNNTNSISNKPQFDDESDEDSDDNSNDDETNNTSNLPRREHKRLKHWGKKNKKLRDKNPYGEDNGVVSYVAYSTNRVMNSSLQHAGINDIKKEKVKRNDPRHAYGSPYIRTTLPHHPSAKTTD